MLEDFRLIEKHCERQSLVVKNFKNEERKVRPSGLYYLTWNCGGEISRTGFLRKLAKNKTNIGRNVLGSQGEALYLYGLLVSLVAVSLGLRIV